MSRTTETQSKHNSRVELEATLYKSDGYEVKAAHISGYEEPDEINGCVPDIHATKGEKEVVIEVETTDSKDDAHAAKQYVAFKKWDLESTNHEFKLFVTE